ncbi:MAG: pyridoxal 5'-phosphate synthase glutaminase subunit PdxT [Smithellaceae bacterium]|nr:pyridoxal 5'-phosphate synthase glutaminase subunit PdxT [Smithellaceae bacterium]
MPAAQGIKNTRRIGVLHLQGGVVEHLRHLERLGLPVVLVKEPDDLTGLAGLIIPGGESTCLGRLLRIFSLDEAIVGHYHAGMKIWGTCAGAILLAKEVTGETPSLALVDMEVERNGFGSQLQSFTDQALIPEIAPEALPLTFIRAPKIVRVGPGVRVLLEKDGFIAAAESLGALVTVFHPELTPCLAFHRYFTRKCRLVPLGEASVPDLDPSWALTSWTGLARIR